MKRMMTVGKDYWTKEGHDVGYHMQELALAVLQEMKIDLPALDMDVASIRLELNTGVVIDPADDQGSRNVVLTMTIQAACHGKSRL